MTEVLNIRFTLDGLNCVLELLGKQPNSSGTYPLFQELQQQGKAELERIQKAKASPALPSDSQSTETASSARSD